MPSMFPTNPIVNQTATVGSKTYQWSGVVWKQFTGNSTVSANTITADTSISAPTVTSNNITANTSITAPTVTSNNITANTSITAQTVNADVITANTITAGTVTATTANIDNLNYGNGQPRDMGGFGTPSSTEILGYVSLVPTNFSSTLYLDTGSKFLRSEYPELSAIFPKSELFNPLFSNSFVNKNLITSLLYSNATTSTASGDYRIIAVKGTTIILMLTGTLAANVLSWNGIISSDSGDNWQNISITTDTRVTWYGITTTTNGKFLAWGLGTTSAGYTKMAVFLSNDGSTWNEYSFIQPSFTIPTISTFGKTSNGTLFTIANSSNKLIISNDNGQNWSVNTISVTTPADTIVFGFKSMLLILSSSAKSLYSLDGAVWNTCAQTITSSTTVVGAAANSKYCIMTMASTTGSNSNDGIVYTGGSYYYTTDGITWSTKTFPTQLRGIGVTVINDYFVVPYTGRFCYVSKDLSSWELMVFGGSDVPFQTTGLPIKIESDSTSNLYVAYVLGTRYNGNTAAILGNVVSVSTTNPTDADRGFISNVSTTITNAKWVVRARP